MPIVVISTTPGMTAAHADQFFAGQGADAGLPEGCTAQIAGPGPDGWQVISVWDSPELAYAYSTEVVMPWMESAGLTAAGPPVVYEAYRVMT